MFLAVIFIAAWCRYTCIFLFSMFVAIYVMDEEMDDFKGRSPYSSTFRTFDSTDYSSIGTNTSRILELNLISYKYYSMDDQDMNGVFFLFCFF